MPTKREREYYRMGFNDGRKFEETITEPTTKPLAYREQLGVGFGGIKKKRKLSAWQKFVKANSKKKIFQYANGKLKLKKMGIAYRKKRR